VSVYLILPAALWPLGSTQLLTEMSARNLPEGKGRPARKADNLTTICEPIRLTTLWASTACYKDSFTFVIIIGSLSSLQVKSPSRWCVLAADVVYTRRDTDVFRTKIVSCNNVNVWIYTSIPLYVFMA
jgi:hypothetical protein